MEAGMKELKQNFNKSIYQQYLSEGFKAIRCKGYNTEYNPEKNYNIAKHAIDIGFTRDHFSGLKLLEIEAWEKTGGWLGWLIPKGYIAIDVENKESIEFIKSLCMKLNITPPEHNSNKGKHFFFKLPRNLSASSGVFTKCGLKVTHRIGGKN